MAATKRLKTLLGPLLRQLRIDGSQLEESESYVMEAQGITLQWEESPRDYLTLSCLLPMRESDFSDPATLNVLLQCNALGLAHPPVLTATLPEQRQVLLWSREAFVLLEPHQLLTLFERFTQQAEKVQRFLQLPAVEKE
ncbi:CesT family type III secretion system chaperone [Erwinia sp. CGal63]|uniref:CesT family type III secretion system chaperone n=1 Tax=Erwinia sp. CGal63 TaxID=2919889 RepID=UPI0030097473